MYLLIRVETAWRHLLLATPPNAREALARYDTAAGDDKALLVIDAGGFEVALDELRMRAEDEILAEGHTLVDNPRTLQ